jgi:hypothetical protein
MKERKKNYIQQFLLSPYPTNGTNFGLPYAELLASFPLHKFTMEWAPVVYCSGQSAWWLEEPTFFTF